MINQPVYQIAIDGPSGAGKSTIAQAVAKKLHFTYINTGGMYRCYALALINAHTDLDDLKSMMDELHRHSVTFCEESLLLDHVDVTKQINDNTVAAVASKIATIKDVRDLCVKNQQAIAKGINCVMEGRDITTVVLPNATLKVYLDGDLDLRAKRRWIQHNKVERLDVVKQKIIARDYQDSHRAYHPLTKTPDSYVIYDDQGWTIDQVSDMIIKRFKEITHA